MAAGQDVDVAVIGAGPAGWAVAAALAPTGLRVALLGDDGQGWPNTYGVWCDEVVGVVAPSELEAVWPQARVHTGQSVRVLPRAYGRIDGDTLRGRLVKDAVDAGALVYPGQAVAAAHDVTGVTVGCDDGQAVRARLLVDATGHRPALVHRAEPEIVAAQVAVGWRVALSRPPYPPGSLTLMDFRDGHLDHVERRHELTFCYAMDYGDGTWFVEETSLARRPPLDPARLEHRLRRRLAEHGAEPVGEPREECVWIPLDSPVPPPQRVVGLGGAASMVHPATGYLLASVLLTAPRLARAVATVLRDPQAPPHAAAHAGWQAVWPAAARRRQGLYRFGLEALLRLDPEATRRFFEAFFAVADTRWRGYLSATLSPLGLAATMAGVFARADRSLRAELTAAALGRPGRALLAELARTARTGASPAEPFEPSRPGGERR